MHPQKHGTHRTDAMKGRAACQVGSLWSERHNVMTLRHLERRRFSLLDEDRGEPVGRQGRESSAGRTKAPARGAEASEVMVDED